jgi:hypothetical protein
VQQGSLAVQQAACVRRQQPLRLGEQTPAQIDVAQFHLGVGEADQHPAAKFGIGRWIAERRER